MFKFFMKLLLALFVVMVAVVGLAFFIGNKRLIRRQQQMRSVTQNFFELYGQKRSAEDEKRRMQNLAVLAKTGVGKGCDFSARRGEEENRDLYNAIKTAKDNNLPISLVDAELFAARLDGIDLTEANLSGANLIGAHLEGANLYGAFFVRSSLSGAKLQGANMSYAKIWLADLSLAKLNGADLTGAGLDEAVLVMTNLSDANLTKASLREAVIYKIHSQNTKFVEANFHDAQIINTFAKNADFTGAQFDGWIMRSFNKLILWVILVKEGLQNTIQDKMAQRQVQNKNISEN